MKKSILALLLIGSFFMVMTPTAVIAEDYAPAAYQCAEGEETATLTIKAISPLAYDTDEITVTPDTCYKITLQNDETGMYHNLKVTADRAVGGVDDDSGFWFIVGGDAGIIGGESDTVYVKTPATPATYYFYCTIPSHETSMNGAFIVSDGNEDDAPGFGFALAFLGLAALPILRKRN